MNILNILLLLIVIILPVITLGTYYYTYNFIKYIKSNPNCSNCITSNYKCNNILHYAPIALVIIMIINLIHKTKLLNINNSLLLLASLCSMIIYVWFISCLYHNLKNIDENNCPCVKDKHFIVKNLKWTSKLLYYLMFVPIVVFVLSFIFMLVSKLRRRK